MGKPRGPDPTDVHVGSRVRMRRMMLGISQEKLGIPMGVTFQQVQKYEKGTNRISASRLQQIAHVLSVPVSFFFEGAPDASGQLSPLATAHRADAAQTLSEGEAQAVLAFRQIPQNLQPLAIRILRVMGKVYADEGDDTTG